MRAFILVLCAVFLASCATEQNYQKLLDTWVGSNEGNLIASWGPPDSVYESDGTKYLTYSKSSTGYFPGTPPSYQTTMIGSTAYTTAVGGTSGFAYSNNCKTTFTIQNRTITSWRYEGNRCVAK
jgi:hypothetical protein